MGVIRFHCECGKDFEVDESWAGRAVACRLCGRRFRVPSPQPAPGLSDLPPDPLALAALDAAHAAPLGPSRLAPRRVRRSLPVKQIALGIGIVVVVGALAIGGWAVWRLASRGVDVLRGNEAALWTVVPDPPAPRTEVTPALRLSHSYRIPVTPTTRVCVLGVNPRYFALASDEIANPATSFAVWDLVTEKTVFRLESNPGWTSILALAPDGRAIAGETANGELLCCEANGTRWQSPLSQLRSTTTSARFLPQGVLFVVRATDDSVRVNSNLSVGVDGPLYGSLYNGASGAILAEYRFEPGNCDRLASSPGGRYLAYRSVKNIVVYDLTTGQLSGSILCAPDANRFSATTDAARTWFSPDGATLFARIEESLFCWDCATGRRRQGDVHWQAGYSDACPLEGSAGAGYTARALEYVPHDVDLWRYTVKDAQRQDILEGRFPVAVYPMSRSHWLVQCLPIPGPREVELVRRMESGDPAQLRPGQSVQIEIRMVSILYGNAATIQPRLTEAAGKLLTKRGFRPGPGGSVRLRVDYVEKGGEQIEFLTREQAKARAESNLARIESGAPVVNSGPTGKIVQGTRVEAALSLVAIETGDILWTDVRTAKSSTLTLLGVDADKATEAGMSESALDILVRHIEDLVLPAYIGQDPADFLPGRTEFRYDPQQERLVAEPPEQ